jgi:hypothetical protein
MALSGCSTSMPSDFRDGSSGSGQVDQAVSQFLDKNPRLCHNLFNSFDFFTFFKEGACHETDWPPKGLSQ